jgi:hypothetical protein
MSIFGKLQDELKRLTHAVLDQLLLGLLDFAEFLEQDLDDWATCIGWESFLEAMTQLT